MTATFLIGFGDAAGARFARFARFAGLGAGFEAGWGAFRWAAGLLAAFAGIGLVYRLAPAGRAGRPVATPGTAFAVAAWLAASYGLRVYAAGSSSYNDIYGSVVGVVVLALWLYLSALALLIGAEIDAEIERAA